MYEIKPVIKKIDLGDYAEAYAGQVVELRVNVAQGTIARMVNPKELGQEEFFDLLSELWGAEWPAEKVKDLWGACEEYDPQLWQWLTGRTWELVMDYRGFVKKN